MKKLKVLVACEESQEVTKAFRELGHIAFSCDLQECSGGHPEWHIKGDVLNFLYDGWDLIIAHPPCTDLSVSGARHFEKKREDGRQKESIEFFCKFLNLPCKYVAIENPIGIISGDYIIKYFPKLCDLYKLPVKPSQIIQPYEYGHPYTKSTCLWLKNLPLLKPTEILEKPTLGWENQSFTKDGRYGGFNNKFSGGKNRSKTFPGIAKAMAEQWCNYILNEEEL